MYRILVIGEGLFADTVSRLLVRENGKLAFVDHIRPDYVDRVNVNDANPSVIIYADARGDRLSDCVLLVGAVSVPVIYTDLRQSSLRIFVQHWADARLSDLLDQLHWLIESENSTPHVHQARIVKKAFV